MNRYPLSENVDSSLIKSKTGKTVSEITVSNILAGNVSSEDIKISKETLLLQGEIAKEASRPQLQQNFIRASELIDVPDEKLLEIYDKLRPNRATKEELLGYVEELQVKYNAKSCAELVLEAIRVYEKRGILKV